jgi:hypothetical protein
MINITESEVSYYPYPHILFKKIFSENIYNHLKDEFPTINELNFNSFDNKRHELKQSKYNLTNLDKNFNNIIKNKKFTFELYNFLKSETFINSLIFFLNSKNLNINYNSKENFYKKLIKRFILKKIDFTFEFSAINTDGGFINPHTDGPNKIITLIIPLIDNSKIYEVKNCGTKILETHDEKYSYNFMNKTVPWEAIKIVKEIPFLDNQMMMFIKTHNSLHSVGPIESFDNSLFRKSINFCICG